MNSVRREKILGFIEESGAATVKQLSALFPGVSLMTIHRDLDFLEAENLIERVRGGARLPQSSVEPRFETRERVNSGYKRIIAQKALLLIQPGSAVFIDAGTTGLALARLLSDMELSVFTTGPNIAVELMKLTRPSINICGGNLSRDNLALSGRSTLDMIAGINIDTAFIGTGGYTAESGFTGGKESEAAVKALVISKARTAVALTDSSKIGRILPFTFARLPDFDAVVNDGRLPASFLDEAKRLNITVL